jgi:pimeloyl-ACP methyl ester carboxylesterase
LTQLRLTRRSGSVAAPVLWPGELIEDLPETEASAGLGRTIRLPDGRRIGYDEFGDPLGFPLIFLHGFGSSRVVRHPDDLIAAELGIRMLAVDRPGIGLSTGQPGRALTDWPADVRQLVDALGLRRFGVVGWSGGGPYALACAWAMPDRVAVVGLISSAAPLIRGADYMLRTHRVAIRAADHAPWMIRLAMWRWSRAQRADPERHLDDAIEGMIEADRLVLEDPRLRAIMIGNATELYRQGGRGLYDEALVIARPWGFPLADVVVPVRIWHGEDDTAVPVGMGRYLARQLPSVRATFYPGEGHHLVYDRWREIMAALAAEQGLPTERRAVG